MSKSLNIVQEDSSNNNQIVLNPKLFFIVIAAVFILGGAVALVSFQIGYNYSTSKNKSEGETEVLSKQNITITPPEKVVVTPTIIVEPTSNGSEFVAQPTIAEQKTVTSAPLPTSKNSVVSGQSLTVSGVGYTLPAGWSLDDRGSELFFSYSSGGYILVKAYSYDGVTGRRELYCKISGYCIDSTTFSPMSIGNISGYAATSIDNSGGGPEYFGAKGNKFYIISTYQPPNPAPNRDVLLASFVF